MVYHHLHQFFALRDGITAVLAGFTVLLVAGCNEPAAIREYTVSKPPAPAETDRMLAAMVPDEQSPVDSSAKEKNAASDGDDPTKEPAGPQAWFFKIVGPADQVSAAAASFDKFVASIRTEKEGLPEWTLPEGWKDDPTGKAPRFGREASIRIGQGSSQLELAVSRLPMPKEGRESWLLGNINRWRGQLELPAIARSELQEFTDEIKAGDQTAIKVDFRGKYAGPPAAKMFAGDGIHGRPETSATKTPSDSASAQAAAAQAAAAQAAAATASARRPLPFDADVPSDWKPGRMNEFRVAAYYVGGGEGAAPAEVIVTPLGPAAGDLKANVDRWRGEIKLPPITTGELAELTKKIEVDGQQADYVHLIGPAGGSSREATLGVILRRPDRVWFFKLRGPVDVVEREKEQFETFVKSVKFK
jgi:hypothetical protein